MVIDDIKEWPSHDEVEMDCQVEALLAIAFGFSCPFFSSQARYAAGTSVELESNFAARCMSSKLCRLPKPGATAGRDASRGAGDFKSASVALMFSPVQSGFGVL